MHHNKLIYNSSFLFFYSLLIQFILLQYVFDGSFENILKFSHDSIIYNDNLNKIQNELLSKNNLNIFFEYPYVQYPILIFNYIVEFLTFSSQLGYFITNSILIVFSYIICVKIFGLYEFDKSVAMPFILLISFLINPYIYYFSLFRGEDLLIFSLYLYVIFFIFYFYKFSFKNLIDTLDKHNKFKFLFFLFLVFTAYLFWLRSSIILLLLFGVFFFQLFFLLKKTKFLNLIISLFILSIFLFLIDYLSLRHEIFYNLFFDQNKYLTMIPWEKNIFVPDIIENFLRILSNKRSLMFDQSTIYNSFVGVSKFEVININNIYEFIYSFPLIFFNSIFIFEFDHLINSSDPIFLIHFAYSFLAFISLILIIFEFKYLNLYKCIFLSIYILTNIVIYYVTPIDGTFYRYMMPLNFILSSYGLLRIFMIAKYFYYIILKYINVRLSKEFTENIKITLANTFSNSFLFILFSILIFFREFIIFNDFHFDQGLIIYFIIMSIISFLSIAFINPFTDTLTVFLRDRDSNQLICNLLYIFIFIFILVFLILCFFEQFLGNIYNIDNYSNNFIFFSLFIVILSIPINSVFSSYLIIKDKSNYIFINQLIIPIIFFCYYFIVDINKIETLYNLLSISVLINLILLLLTCIKYDFSFKKPNFELDILKKINSFFKVLIKNIINNIYIPTIFFLSILITANINIDQVIYMGISLKLLSFFYIITITLLSSTVFNFLNKNYILFDDNGVFKNLIILILPIMGLIFIFYPFILFFLEPFIKLTFKDLNSIFLYENIVFIIFIMPLLVFFGMNNKFFIFNNKQYLLFISNIISLILIIISYFLFNKLLTINHFLFILFTIFCFLFFSYLFLFNSLKYKILSILIFLIFSFILYSIYYLIFSNLFLIIFYSMIIFLLTLSIKMNYDINSGEKISFN